MGVESSLRNKVTKLVTRNFLPCMELEVSSVCSCHKSLPVDPVLSQMNPVHILVPCFFQIHLNMINLCLALTTGLFLSGFLMKILYECLNSCIHLYIFCPSCFEDVLLVVVCVDQVDLDVNSFNNSSILLRVSC